MNTRSHFSCISLGIVVLGPMFGSSSHLGCGAEKSSSGSAENGEGSPHLPSAQTTTSMQETPRIQTPVDLDPARSNTLDETLKIFPTPDGFFNDHRGRLDGTFDSKGLALSIGKTGEYNIGLETESVGCERGMENTQRRRRMTRDGLCFWQWWASFGDGKSEWRRMNKRTVHDDWRKRFRKVLFGPDRN